MSETLIPYNLTIPSAAGSSERIATFAIGWKAFTGIEARILLSNKIL